jgi:hypothetical protein
MVSRGPLGLLCRCSSGLERTRRAQEFRIEHAVCQYLAAADQADLVGPVVGDSTVNLAVGRSSGNGPLAMTSARQMGTKRSRLTCSSRQSVSRGISPSCIEKPAVAAGCAGPARRRGRHRRAGLVNSRQLPVMSLSRPFPVPQCRLSSSPTVVAPARQARSG